MAGGTPVASQQQQWAGGGMSTGPQAWRGGRGRGGFTRGRGGGGFPRHGGGWHDNTRSDAIVLGGGDGNEDDTMDRSTGSPEKGVGGGRMQQVGGKWVFVRDPVPNLNES